MMGTEASIGTRFLLYPQSPTTPGYEKPELVWISARQGSIQPGPQNDRMYVVNPTMPKKHYDYPYLPPFRGAKAAPVEPSPDGHFDHIDPNSRDFLGVHVFGSVARILDIWEGFIGHRINWHFAETYERLEIIPLIDWDNAQSGYGMLEFGYRPTGSGGRDLFALNFDVIAHEIGHSILFSEVGLPPVGVSPTPDLFAFYEGVSDLISLIGMLHFDTAMDRLLRRGSGNLMALNELNRVAELADERQIRIAGNSRKMGDVGFEVHDRSRPFTGAIFDALVQTYHDLAVDRGLVDLPPGSIADARDFDADLERTYARAFEADYDLKHFQLKAALGDARDIIAQGLADSWQRLNSETLTFADAGLAVCAALQAAGHGRVAEGLVECLEWRDIISPYDVHQLWQGRPRPVVWI
ncbi:hypothetical protein OS190_06630 [Sulfitobacter sp. F26204]|uniref:hypothetical protein n=1 Tax=Sulfitobacter sp. F26204 TaxID=2996014 RepID=UPI00225E0963|nr:hypothetical protein [Sulfitobacter sp. F26204]MCX7559240.1 hypothetical protein [Sulfitobacter sp. F26204]